MRVNIYDEEQTGRLEVVEATVRGEPFIGLRFYLELPVTTPHGDIQGPFTPNPVAEDTAAVTFWNWPLGTMAGAIKSHSGGTSTMFTQIPRSLASRAIVV